MPSAPGYGSQLLAPPLFFQSGSALELFIVCQNVCSDQVLHYVQHLKAQSASQKPRRGDGFRDARDRRRSGVFGSRAARARNPAAAAPFGPPFYPSGKKRGGCGRGSHAPRALKARDGSLIPPDQSPPQGPSAITPLRGSLLAKKGAF